jgi:hypothetical protein
VVTSGQQRYERPDVHTLRAYSGLNSNAHALHVSCSRATPRCQLSVPEFKAFRVSHILHLRLKLILLKAWYRDIVEVGAEQFM